jgi:hypothetical protein
MIVHQGRVILCKTSAHFAAEGSVVSSIGCGSVSVLAALPEVIQNDCRARAACCRHSRLFETDRAIESISSCFYYSCRTFWGDHNRERD